MPQTAAFAASTILSGLAKTTSATVGIDKTFTPAGKDANGVTTYEDRSGGIMAGYPRFTLAVRRPTKTSRLYKMSAKLWLPTMEVTAPTTVTGIQPAPTKAYDHMGSFECMFPERGTLAERMVFFSLWHSLFCTTINASDDLPTDPTGSPIYHAMVNLDPPY